MNLHYCSFAVLFKYSKVIENIINMLLPFSTTRLRELHSSAVINIKNKKHERILIVEQEM